MKIPHVIIPLLFLIQATIPVVQAHTIISNLIINGQTVPQKSCIRPYPDYNYEYPLYGTSTSDMTCGKLPEASGAADKSCPVAAGSTVGLLWKHTWTSADNDVIDGSHRGPCYVYMAKASTGGQGRVWFKIYEYGYQNGLFCVDTLRANNGRMDVVIPSDIEPGDYLLRGEIIALHEAYSGGKGAQFYVHCAEITVTGGGSSQPPYMTSFPGAYTDSQNGIVFDIYASPMAPYPSLGPQIYRSQYSYIVDDENAVATKDEAKACAKDTDCPSNVCRVDRTCLPEQGLNVASIAAIVFAGLFVVALTVIIVGFLVIRRRRAAKSNTKAAELRERLI